MSTQRTARGGWCNPDKLPRGPNGRALCRQCSNEVPEGRRTFCSKKCVDEWRIKTDPSHVRVLVFQRDRGICAKCGKDVFAATERRPRARGTGDLWQADHIIPVIEGGGECELSNFRTLCTDCHKEETKALRQRIAIKRRGRTLFPLNASCGS
jgi:5-methylcytosine-specific restriction enzyme A